MKHLIYISIFTILSLSLKATNSDFQEANEAYKVGEYNMAIEMYDSILRYGENSQLLYNLGNAYFKTGRVPEAILNYERAYKLAPNDKDIQYNLDIARFQLKDKIEPKPEFFLLTWWKQIAKKQIANQWTIFYFIFLWVSITLFLLFALSHQRAIRKLGFFGGLSSILIAIILLFLAITQHQFETKNEAGIIMTTSVSVKSAPLNTGTDLFIIHSGLKVNILKKEGDWYNIRLADGKEGWLNEQAIEVI